MKFDRQMLPATETSWVVSYGGKTVPRWRTDGRHFENRYIGMSRWKIIQFRWNFVHSSRLWTGWTSRDQKWKSCIGQTPSSTERIPCFFKNKISSVLNKNMQKYLALLLWTWWIFVFALINPSIHPFINTHNAAVIIKYNGHTMNEWIDLVEGHTAWHRLLKYSQNQRFTTQLESMEGSQCESVGLYLSNTAITLSLKQPASVCKITLSLRTIFNQKRILRW